MTCIPRELIQQRRLRPGVAIPTLRLLIEFDRLFLRLRGEDKAHIYGHLATNEALLHYYEPRANHAQKALRFARRAAQLHPPHGKYNLACALALLGRRRDALNVLKGLSPEELRDSSPSTDRDWERYWDDPEFREILQRAQGKEGPAPQQAPGDPSPPGETRDASARPSSRRR
jgi:hypothetical protein